MLSEIFLFLPPAEVIYLINGSQTACQDNLKIKSLFKKKKKIPAAAVKVMEALLGYKD